MPADPGSPSQPPLARPVAGPRESARLAARRPARASPTAIPGASRIPADTRARRAARSAPEKQVSFETASASHSFRAGSRSALDQITEKDNFSMARLIFVGDRLQLVEPCGRFAVRRRAPVAAGRQRSTRADLGRIGNRAALELALLEEP